MVRVQTRCEEAAREFSRRIVERRQEVQAVILYGSVARGEANEDSDVDLVILADTDANVLQEEALTLAMEIGEEFKVFVQEVVESVSDFRSRAVEGYPWQRTIARMGQPLFDRGVFAQIKDALPPPPRIAEEGTPYRASREAIDDCLASAEEALTAARLLLNERLWNDASNRAYYAMFNAASAAVIFCGVEDIRSHRALIKLFGRHVVFQRGLESAYRRDLEAAFKLRLRADYERGFYVDESAARTVVQNAALFIATIHAFVAEP